MEVCERVGMRVLLRSSVECCAMLCELGGKRPQMPAWGELW